MVHKQSLSFPIVSFYSYISVSLLTLVVTACGLALFGVSLFVSWKLCWVPWRERGLFSGSKDNNQEPLNYTDTETNEQENSEDFLDPPTPCPDSSMKISHTSPDIPLSTQPGDQENCAHTIRVQRQVTEPTPSARHNSIRRQLNLSNPDFNIHQLQRQEQLTGIGKIKPELYKQRSLDNDDGRRSNSKACGKLNFILKYDCDLEQLIVKIHKAVNLPAKDFSGTSDPYVKIYLLPDRKTKHQTKVHRKTLNPVFDEVFLFPVPYNDLEARKLHFSVYDFDRFSRHDLIGQVVVDHFFDLADFPRECILWKDIEYVTNVTKLDFLGELMLTKCLIRFPEATLRAFCIGECCPFHHDIQKDQESVASQGHGGLHLHVWKKKKVKRIALNKARMIWDSVPQFCRVYFLLKLRYRFSTFPSSYKHPHMLKRACALTL
ncbi:Syt9 [Phodopus roborovskii]|uniref:Syt9 protein n=1 Tax=Phodopus roborovskii TaxID=109678 RepID=A0AAU9ZJT7_PHORO|nr:Syt9 [Phodopus roborovskii]